MKVRICEKGGRFFIEVECFDTPLITYYHNPPWWAAYWPLSLLCRRRWCPLISTGLFQERFLPESEGTPVAFATREDAAAKVERINKAWAAAEGDRVPCAGGRPR